MIQLNAGSPVPKPSHLFVYPAVHASMSKPTKMILQLGSNLVSHKLSIPPVFHVRTQARLLMLCQGRGRKKMCHEIHLGLRHFTRSIHFPHWNTLPSQRTLLLTLATSFTCFPKKSSAAPGVGRWYPCSEWLPSTDSWGDNTQERDFPLLSTLSGGLGLPVPESLLSQIRCVCVGWLALKKAYSKQWLTVTTGKRQESVLYGSRRFWVVSRCVWVVCA